MTEAAEPVTTAHAVRGVLSIRSRAPVSACSPMIGSWVLALAPWGNGYPNLSQLNMDLKVVIFLWLLSSISIIFQSSIYHPTRFPCNRHFEYI